MKVEITIDVSRIFLILVLLPLVVLFANGIISQKDTLTLAVVCLLLVVLLDTVRISGFKKWFEDREKEEVRD